MMTNKHTTTKDSSHEQTLHLLAKHDLLSTPEKPITAAEKEALWNTISHELPHAQPSLIKRMGPWFLQTFTKSSWWVPGLATTALMAILSFQPVTQEQSTPWRNKGLSNAPMLHTITKLVHTDGSQSIIEGQSMARATDILTFEPILQKPGSLYLLREERGNTAEWILPPPNQSPQHYPVGHQQLRFGEQIVGVSLSDLKDSHDFLLIWTPAQYDYNTLIQATEDLLAGKRPIIDISMSKITLNIR